MVAPALIALGASLLGNALTGKGEQKQIVEPSLTPEQKQALNMLLHYGQYGGQGMEYDGALGNYAMSPVESGATSRLLRYVNQDAPGLGASYDTAENELKRLISGDAYDPMNAGGVYSGYRDSVMRELQESKDRLRRDAAMGGNLYNTGTMRGMADLEGRAMEGLTNKTGELFQNYANQRISAIPQLANMALRRGEFDDTMTTNRLGAGFQYGGLNRAIEDQKAKDIYSNFIGNRQTRLGALSAALGTKATDTVVPYQTQSPFQKLWDTGINLSANALGGQIFRGDDIFGVGRSPDK
jgi:hypothetical protein